MNNTLIIVESPTKSRIIKKFLGAGYDVVSSMGHVRDLPVKKFGVEIDNQFSPEYEIIKKKTKILSEIKAYVKNTKKIYLAMDEDREGEAIGWHLLEALKINEKTHSIDRIVFHEITAEALKDAVMNPRKLNMNLVDAQQARRIIDRIVGYKISPLLSKSIRRGLSAGRVQSVGLKMIVLREKERLAFVPNKYFTVEGLIEKKSIDIKLKLIGKDGEKFDKLQIDNQNAAEEIINSVKDKEVIVVKIEEKEKKNNALPPFITSTLQQESYNLLHFNPAKTMAIAQQLYEGIELQDGSSQGLITYMRTDSVNIAQSAVVAVRKYIKEKIAEAYLPETPNTYKSKKSAQEAHECIRPTNIFKAPDGLKQVLSDEQFKLYELIWSRFVSSQMKPALIKSLGIDFLAGAYDFRATGQKIIFDGFTKVWRTKFEDIILPEMELHDKFGWKDISFFDHETKPSARYTPATLIKELEKNGIGRPSTYATILNTLFKRKYIYSDSGALVPNEVGIVVVDILDKHFSGIMDYTFTAKMEENLDEIASGKQGWQDMMKEFYEKFEAHYEVAVKTIEKVKDETTDIKCPKCDAAMLIRWGRNGKFIACSGYPECRQTFNIDENGEIVKEEKTDMKCPKCSSPMLIKNGRFGKFLACSSYPKCKQSFMLDKDGKPVLPPILKCPDCGEDTVVRVGRKGKFIACSGYPKCKFAMSFNEAKKKNS